MTLDIFHCCVDCTEFLPLEYEDSDRMCCAHCDVCRYVAEELAEEEGETEDRRIGFARLFGAQDEKKEAEKEDRRG